MPAMPESYMVPMKVPAVLFPNELPVNLPGKSAEEGSSTWAPANHMGEPDGVPGISLAQPWKLRPVRE